MPPKVNSINLFGNFSFRTGYFEMRCFKSRYYSDLKLVTWLDNEVIEQVYYSVFFNEGKAEVWSCSG